MLIREVLEYGVMSASHFFLTACEVTQLCEKGGPHLTTTERGVHQDRIAVHRSVHGERTQSQNSCTEPHAKPVSELSKKDKATK